MREQGRNQSFTITIAPQFEPQNDFCDALIILREILVLPGYILVLPECAVLASPTEGHG